MNSSGGLFRFFREFVAPDWLWFAGGAVTMALTNLISLQLPVLAKDIVNISLTGNSSRALTPVNGIILLGSLLVVVRFLSRAMFFWPGRKFEAAVRSSWFRKILGLRRSFFFRFVPGDLLSRLANDTEYLRVLFAFGGMALTNMIFLSVFALVKMTALNSYLTLFSLLPFLFAVVYFRFVLPWMHKCAKHNQKANAQLTARVTELFGGLPAVRMASAEQAFLSRIDAVNRRVYRSNIRLLYLDTFVFPLISFLAGLSQVVVLLYGGSLLASGRISPGDILLFNTYIVALAFPLAMTGALLAMVERGRSALERLQEPLKGPGEDENDSADGLQGTESWMRMEVSGLSWEREKFKLQEIRFSLRRGEIVGLCGPVGCGKSTLLDLLVRLEQLPSGTVSITAQDGVVLDPVQLPLEQLRRRIVYVQQQAMLFSDTVRNNFLFGLDSMPVSDRKLEQAAAAVLLHEDIQSFNEGWETVIGERGIRLSGGQRQRVTLARALLRSPDFLLLDDVLSAVDEVTASKIMQNIKKLQQGVLLVSHRKVVLQNCDRVIYLQDGRQAGCGSWWEMLAMYPDMEKELIDE